MITCHCKDWQKNISKLYFSLKQQALTCCVYDGKVFKFCPWCGSKLVKKQDDVIDKIIKETFKHIGTKKE